MVNKFSGVSSFWSAFLASNVWCFFMLLGTEANNTHHEVTVRKE
jgi:hypothetical protein